MTNGRRQSTTRSHKQTCAEEGLVQSEEHEDNASLLLREDVVKVPHPSFCDG